jgi:hypothetical protein
LPCLNDQSDLTDRCYILPLVQHSPLTTKNNHAELHLYP